MRWRRGGCPCGGTAEFSTARISKSPSKVSWTRPSALSCCGRRRRLRRSSSATKPTRARRLMDVPIVSCPCSSRPSSHRSAFGGCTTRTCATGADKPSTKSSTGCSCRSGRWSRLPTLASSRRHRLSPASRVPSSNLSRLLLLRCRPAAVPVRRTAPRCRPTRRRVTLVSVWSRRTPAKLPGRNRSILNQSMSLLPIKVRLARRAGPPSFRPVRTRSRLYPASYEWRSTTAGASCR
jgi:hypothetical protein